MEIFANDLSIHQQYYDLNKFRAALSRVMKMRQIAKQFGVDLSCPRSLINKCPISGKTMLQAIASLPSNNEKRAVMSWLTKYGPFLDDLRSHSEEDYLESCDDVVTDTAVGEAGFRKLHDIDCGLVSFSPSDWCFSPVPITWRQDEEGFDSKTSEVENWWSCNQLREDLKRMPSPILSWKKQYQASVARFNHLKFSDDSFSYLDGVPFARSSADRVFALLKVLDELAGQYDENGIRTSEGHRLYSKYFTGTKALFSDSSESEKHRFRKQLTFKHADYPEKNCFVVGMERNHTYCFVFIFLGLKRLESRYM